MNRFCELKEYQLLELQEDLKTICMIKENNYVCDLDDEEIEEIKYYKRLFKKISNELNNVIKYIRSKRKNVYQIKNINMYIIIIYISIIIIWMIYYHYTRNTTDQEPKNYFYLQNLKEYKQH